ncbi:MAG: PAS domain S-box protein [Bacteroidales bacterium]
MDQQKPTYQDLQERISHLESLLEQKSKGDFLENAFESSSIGVAQVTPEGKFILVNRRFCEMLGYSADELYRLNFSDITHPDDRSPEEKFFSEILAGTTDQYQIEKRYLHKTGREVWIRLYAKGIRNEQGKIVYGVANVVEISDLKNAEEALRRSERKYRQLIENINDIIWENNSEGVCTYVSPRIKDILGYEPEEITGRKIADFFPENESDEMYRKFLAMIGEQKPVEGLILNVRARNGQIVSLETNCTPVYDSSGRFAGYQGIDRDITRRKKTEREKEDTESRLKEVYKRARIGFWDVDLLTGRVHFSDELTAMLGYEVSDIPDFRYAINEIIHPGDREAIASYYNKLLHHGESLSFDFRILKKDGSVLYMHCNANPGMNPEGEVTQVWGTVQDITRHKMMESALKESEERFRLLSDVSFEGIVIQRRGIVMDINKSFEKLTGYTARESVGKNLFRVLVSEDDYNRARDLLQKDQTKPYVVEIIRKNGTRFWAEIEGRSIMYKGQEIRIAAIRDISEKVQMEKALSSSEEKYRHVINNTLEGIFVIQDQYFVYANPAVEMVSGYNWQYIKKIRFDEFVYEPDREMVIRNYQNRMKGMNIPSYDLRIIDKNREPRWMHLNATRINWEGGDAVLCFITDIHDRKMAEIALQAHGERYKSILHTAMDGLILADQSGKIVEVSDAYMEMSGFNKEELLKMKIRDLDAGKSGDDAQEHPHGMIRKGSNRFESLHRRKDGSVFPVDVSVSFRQKEHEYSVFFVRDITRQKKASEALKEALRKAEESDRLKSAFLANMSHEIRTPMNGIMGFADLLKEPNLSGDEKDRYLGMIEKSGERMLNIINDLINISKIEAGQMEISMAETCINEILEYLDAFFKPEVERKGMKLAVISPLPDREAVAVTDNEKLYAVLANLIKNAIKYTETGTITVGYYNRNQSLEFFVKDTGIGIPADQQEMIFNRFAQVSMNSGRSYEGAGLGLSIAKAYVEMLGGKIWLKSAEGAGSTFYFTIPLNSTHVHDTHGQKPADQSPRPEKLNNLNILIAEDDETAGLFFSGLFKSGNNTVIQARTGAEAVRMALEHKNLDLILMDIKMPEMNGYEATQEIRKFNTEVVIIAQTAFAQSGDREKALAAGCNDYIAKPIKRKILFEMISQHMPAITC